MITVEGTKSLLTIYAVSILMVTFTECGSYAGWSHRSTGAPVADRSFHCILNLEPSQPIASNPAFPSGPSISLLQQFFGILYFIQTVASTIYLCKSNPAYDLLPVFLMWLNVGTMFTGINFASVALQTLDVMELSRFGLAVLTGLLLQVAVDSLMLMNPNYWNEWIKNVKRSCFYLGTYILLELFLTGFQMALACSAFVLADRSSILPKV